MDNIRNWWIELHYTPLQKRSLAAIAAMIVAISTFLILRTSTPTQAVAKMPIEVESTAATIVVDVEGEVTRPGVYHLEASARVFDAIRAAGGLTKKADPSDVNQARLLTDGEQIYIYGQNSPTSTTKNGAKVTPRAAAFVLVNRATAKEFEALDGIGPVLANRIISYRKAHGPFATIDDLLKVPGIGSTTLSKFKAKLRV
jgi:competence protein ComEA